MKLRTVTALLVLGAIIAGACATRTTTSDGASYDKIFRGRWWSYYDRGIFYLAHGEYDAAITDFEKAIKGRSKDSWRARTYGLHFAQYFPNREMGVALYEAGRLDEAEAFLLRALEQVDTERAYRYRDKVTKTRIAQGVIQDDVEPEIVTNVEPAQILASRELEFEVTAKDDVGVEEVKVNGEAFYQRGSQEQVLNEKKILLEEGKQEIEVAAKDLAAKETVKKVEVVVDLTGPTIGVFNPIEPTVTEEGTVVLEGASVDTNGVTTVGVGERMLAESPGDPRLDFGTELPLIDGENTFVVAARDVAGNETRSALKVFRGDPESVEAKLWLLEQRNPDGIKLALSGAVPLDVLLAATEAPGREIRIKSPALDRPYRNDRTLRISGEVVTQTSVASLTINGEPFESLTGAPKESFNKRIPIEEGAIPKGGGTLSVKIAAKDAEGNTLEEDFQVEVQPVLLDKKDTKLAVSVLPFGGEDLGNVNDFLRTRAESEILNQDRFRVVDRDELQTVLTEQQLAQLADPKDAIKLGKVINAHLLLTSEIYVLGDSLEVLVRAVNPETQEVEEEFDASIENKDDTDALKALCKAVAVQLRQKYPRRSGEVLAAKKKGDQYLVLMDWTEADGIRPGTRFLILQEEEAEEDLWGDVDTEEETSPPDYFEVGRARVRRIVSKGAECVVEELVVEGIELEQGMPAVTM